MNSFLLTSVKNSPSWFLRQTLQHTQENTAWSCRELNLTPRIGGMLSRIPELFTTQQHPYNTLILVQDDHK